MSKDWFTEEQFKAAKKAAENNTVFTIEDEAMLAALRAINPFEWRGIESAPKDRPFYATAWSWDWGVEGRKESGRWFEPKKYQFATDPRDEQCFHSIPRGSCIRDTYADQFRWSPAIDLPPAPEGE